MLAYNLPTKTTSPASSSSCCSSSSLMNSGGGLKMEICEYNNGLILIEGRAAMEVDYVEKDPRGRYIRVFYLCTKNSFFLHNKI